MRTKQPESYSRQNPFEEATMIQNWLETAAERAVRSPLNDYERRGLLRSTYRFSLHGLHYDLHPDPDERVVQASVMAANPKHPPASPTTLRNMRELGVQIARLGIAAILLFTATILLFTAMDISIAAPSPTQIEQQVPPVAER
jgi:hypothetical protein